MIEKNMREGAAVRCVALDLDRTVLNKEGRLSAGNRKALAEIIAAGVHVIIASGRAFDTLPRDMVELPGVEYAITLNGAAMYHVPTGKCLKRYRLSEKAADAIMSATEKAGVTYEAFIGGAAYAGKDFLEDPEAFGVTPQAVSYVRTTRRGVDDIVRFIYENRRRLDSMDMIVRDEEQQRKVWSAVADATDEVYITSSIRNLVEVADKNAGKKAGLAFFAELLGLQREETAAFGDADNDIDMIRYAGCGIAMANASEACRKAADFITGHHDEDGVAEGLKNILKLIS
ncbi:MAG: Cof-type HAD-IIB family hydrolase [Blautia sp.]|nr:Cof-type HAD-IIB family hydrolase [Blautia sp.]MCM1199723.1 Cof-type HAD-IIB family hydrolase [Bacteroides fragilis]